MRKFSGNPISDETGLDRPQRELNQLFRWEKDFRADARTDKHATFRNHMERLDLPGKPQLMVEGTIRVMQAVWVYNNIDGQTSDRLVSLQKYDCSKAPDTKYVFTFDLIGKAYARILVVSKFGELDLADLLNHPFDDYKIVGYNSISISHPDWSPLSKREIEDRGFNNEVQHLEEQKGVWYSKWIWESNISI